MPKIKLIYSSMTRQFYTLVAVRLLGSVQTPHRAFKSDYHFLRSRYRYHQMNSSDNPARFDKKNVEKIFLFFYKTLFITSVP